MKHREAVRLGRKHYMADFPCPQGHHGLRRTKDWKCIECEKQRKRRWYMRQQPVLSWERIKPT